MKKLFALILLFFATGFAGAQNVPGEKQVPDVVKSKFKTEFPSSVIKRWEVKPVIKEYIAIFVDQNLSKRARYDATGKQIFHVIYYPKAAIPAVYTGKVIADFPGFAADWATEYQNKRNNTTTIEVRLSKPSYVLKAWVKPDGSSNTGAGAKEMDPNGDPLPDAPPTN